MNTREKSEVKRMIDAAVANYNDNYFKPMKKLVDELYEKKLLSKTKPLDEKLEIDMYELWHHEGRRARFGVAMMAPDYAWWHGIYDVAHTFYFKFLPSAREYEDEEVNAAIKALLEEDPMHTWIGKGTAELKEAIRSGELQKAYAELFKQD